MSVDRLLLGRTSRRPPPPAELLDLVYLGSVLTSDATSATVELDDMPGTAVGPAPYPGTAIPPAGTRCVVAFAGGRLAGAVVITLLGWP